MLWRPYTDRESAYSVKVHRLPHLYRENDADYPVEHYVPDGPSKDAAVQCITEILRRGEGG